MQPQVYWGVLERLLAGGGASTFSAIRSATKHTLFEARVTHV